MKSHGISETSDANTSLETNSSLETSTDNVAMDPELDTSELDLHLSPNSDKCSDVHVQDKRNFLLIFIRIIVFKLENSHNFVCNCA